MTFYGEVAHITTTHGITIALGAIIMITGGTSIQAAMIGAAINKQLATMIEKSNNMADKQAEMLVLMHQASDQTDNSDLHGHHSRHGQHHVMGKEALSVVAAPHVDDSVENK